MTLFKKGEGRSCRDSAPTVAKSVRSWALLVITLYKKGEGRSCRDSVPAVAKSVRS